MVSYFRNTDNGEFRMVGLSTDTKPTVDIPNGAIFVEMDTGKSYLFDADGVTYYEAASGGGGGGGAVVTIDGVPVTQDMAFLSAKAPLLAPNGNALGCASGSAVTFGGEVHYVGTDPTTSAVKHILLGSAGPVEKSDVSDSVSSIRSAKLFVYNDQLYALGTMSTTQETVTLVYSVADDSWASIPSSIAAMPLFNMNMFEHDGVIHAFSCTNGVTYHHSVFDGSSWATVSDENAPNILSNLSIIFVADSAIYCEQYIFDGNSGYDWKRFTLQNNAWSEVKTVSELNYYETSCVFYAPNGEPRKFVFCDEDGALSMYAVAWDSDEGEWGYYSEDEPNAQVLFSMLDSLPPGEGHPYFMGFFTWSFAEIDGATYCVWVIDNSASHAEWYCVMNPTVYAIGG